MTTPLGVYESWVPDPQRYAVDQERWRHDQTCHAYGEYGMFCLLWRIRDFQAGRVGRCQRCYLAQGKIAETYGQPAQEKCPECFGTTFEGGYRALIVRPVLWDSTEETEQEGGRGVVISAKAGIQTTSDFNSTNGDYMFRGDGSRWQLQKRDAPEYLQTGFEEQTFSRDVVGNRMDAVREDESSVAYIIPPDSATLLAALDRSGFHYPLHFSAIEVIRGPLL